MSMPPPLAASLGCADSTIVLAAEPFSARVMSDTSSVVKAPRRASAGAFLRPLGGGVSSAVCVMQTHCGVGMCKRPFMMQVAHIL
jgi:hypothetical protein